LRLNQLNYFDALKAEEDTERKLDAKNGTVDLTVKVKEKGKNSIGLTGGVSGLEGSFIGLNYETNNFLGLGETLQVQGNVGSLSRVLLFGFTEPYMFDRPLTMGFTVYSRKFDFTQARQASITAGQNLNLPQSVLNPIAELQPIQHRIHSLQQLPAGPLFQACGVDLYPGQHHHQHFQ